MRKLLFLWLISSGGLVHAQSGVATYEKGYSTFTALAVICSSGSSMQLNATTSIPGFKLAEYRLQNTDSADSVYIGNNTNVSTYTATAGVRAVFGEPLSGGSNRTWQIGSNPDLADQPQNPIWCRAADAAGVDGVVMSVVSFGYK